MPVPAEHPLAPTIGSTLTQATFSYRLDHGPESSSIPLGLGRRMGYGGLLEWLLAPSREKG
jgi:hypothetical protein